MFSNPCVCFNSNDQGSRNSKSTKKKASQAIPLYALTSDKSIKSRSDGVVVVNEKYLRPKFPKITDFDKTKVYTWTSSKTPCSDYKFTRFEPQIIEKLDLLSSSTASETQPLKPSNSSACRSKTSSSSNEISINIGDSEIRQKVHGFGGALTDAVCKNLSDLPENLAKELINCYAGEDSAGYQIVRTPISGSDFSERTYTYLDKPNDFELKTFSLEPEDDDKLLWLKYMAKRAAECGDYLGFMCSSWSAPVWMKNNNSFKGRGRLRGNPGDEYHKTWARYLIKFLDVYREKGVEFDYMTIQNEPTNGYAIPAFWNSLGFSASHMRDFVSNDLAPEVEKSKHFEMTKLMMLDDIRLWLPNRPKTIFADQKANSVISGIGVHWYMNYLIGTKALDKTHAAFPDKFMLGTEACHEAKPSPPDSTDTDVQWNRGEKYSNDIMSSLNHWQTGWIDWNMCLDLDGGPNWANNMCDAPVIVNADASEFYLQPMYFHMVHFSKLLVRDSIVIKPDLRNNDKTKVWPFHNKKLKVLVVRRPDDNIVVTLLNTSGDTDYTVLIQDLGMKFYVQAKSIKSVLFSL